MSTQISPSHARILDQVGPSITQQVKRAPTFAQRGKRLLENPRSIRTPATGPRFAEHAKRIGDLAMSSFGGPSADPVYDAKWTAFHTMTQVFDVVMTCDRATNKATTAPRSRVVDTATLLANVSAERIDFQICAAAGRDIARLAKLWGHALEHGLPAARFPHPTTMEVTALDKQTLAKATDEFLRVLDESAHKHHADDGGDWHLRWLALAFDAATFAVNAASEVGANAAQAPHLTQIVNRAEGRMSGLAANFRRYHELIGSLRRAAQAFRETV